MYAVIETGGKQYRVEVGTELEVELLDVEPGKTITLERVLLVGDGADSSIGRPLVAGAEVSAEVVRQSRGEKLISFKYRPKARSRVKKGHRQELTVLRINDITFGGKSAAKTARKAEQDAKTERQRLEEAAVAQAAKDAELAAKLAAAAAKPEVKATGAASRATAAKAKAAKPKPAREPAAAEAAPAAETSAKADEAPKHRRTKATAEADAEAKPETPKRPRASKKDEA
ncbi:MAG TPA: 50S ribosomal protein L21 [Candidatus Limnocylindrales bacterium]